MTENTSQMFITGPGVVKTVTGEETTASELGGAKIHSTKSGVSHFIYKTDEECIEGVKKLLSYLFSFIAINGTKYILGLPI